MKGLKFTFRNVTVSISTEDDVFLSMLVQKAHNKLTLNIVGMYPKKKVDVTWLYTNDMVVGDELLIAKEDDIEQESQPVEIVSSVTQQQKKELVLSQEAKYEMWDIKLRNFSKLEKKLKEKGLI
jgi:hypothetical protein